MTSVACGAPRSSALRPTGTTPASEPAPAAVYEGTVAHRRFVPLVREFAPRVFLAYLDVDALPGSLDPIPLWSARRAAPARFERRDFFDGGTRPLGDAIRELVEDQIGHRPAGRIFLLAQLRTFGWIFNPLAVYYCHTAEGAGTPHGGLDAIVLEVTNTPWGERHWYVFDARGGATSASTPKAMHVSPYLPIDVEYRVTWNTPGAALRLRVEVDRNGAPIFEADLVLRRAALDHRTGPRFLARYPFAPWRTSFAIYREALRLFARRVPLYRHPATRSRGGAR